MGGNDHWTLDLDQLGMKGAGDELARTILSCKPPYAICIQGKWGSGKTSLMRYAMARLGGEPLGTTVKTSKEPIKEFPKWLADSWEEMGKGSEAFIRETFSGQCRYAGDGAHLPEPRIVPIWFNPYPRKLKNFVNTLGAGWAIRNACAHLEIGFSLFLLLSFLRSYHPEVHRLLAYDPGLVDDLHTVLTEGAAQSPASSSPIYYFFRRSFRHAFETAFPDDFKPTRKDEDEVVTELIMRLDRHKGDLAFLRLWRQEFADTTPEEVLRRVTNVLRCDQGQTSES